MLPPPTKADPTWTFTLIRKTVSTYKHLPKLTAAERIMDELPTQDERFALNYSATLELIIQMLDE